MDEAAGESPIVAASGAPRSQLGLSWVDVAIPQHWGAIGLISATTLVFIVIVGFVGPPLFSTGSDLAYICNGTSIVGCYPALEPNTTITRVYTGLSRLSQFWTMTMALGSLDLQARAMPLDFVVTLYGRSSPSAPLKPLRVSQHASELIVCPAGQAYCHAVVVVLELFVTYPTYQLSISFPGQSAAALDWVGDIQFTFTSINRPFSVMAITVRAIYFLITAVALVLFATRLGVASGRKLRTWPSDQRWVLALLASFTLCINPFLPFDYATGSWFLNVITALCVVIFEGTVLSYMLITFDLIRLQHYVESKRVFYGLRFGIVSAIMALLWIAILVFCVKASRDPIAAWSTAPSFSDLIFAVAIVLLALLLYITISIVWASVTLRNAPLQDRRYMVVAVISAVYVGCLDIAALSGNIRPRSAMGFLFFMTLRMLVVLLLTIAFWPLDANGNIGFTAVLQTDPTGEVPLLEESTPIVPVRANDRRFRPSDRNAFA
eukprot:c4168_g1_i1.p1 GENE.c4168_g1_i1~~c4168_g1_i1.p1  ORF type:complete len:492 (-),score=89.82 c4168_g1_i1:304-1779(-)